MPPLPGETTVVSVYADIHYFFGPVAGQAPLHTPHHRFDKGSYLYLYQNAAAGGTGRVELANNPGKEDQDAVAGALENASITYSYDKCTSLTVHPPQAEGESWKLPSYDPTNGPYKHNYPIQSIDIYFWSPEDALQCLNALRSTTGIGGLNLADAPTSQHAASQDDDISPIVKRLETAVTISKDRRYSSAADSPEESHKSIPPLSRSETPIAQISGDAAAAFAPPPAPLAYNPAAPAAPETRMHREKTPPPPMDGPGGIGLNQVSSVGYALPTQYAGQTSQYAYAPAASDPFYSVPPQQQLPHQQHYQPYSQPQAHSQNGYVPPPPQNPPPGGYAPPPSGVSPVSTISRRSVSGIPPPPQTTIPQGQTIPAYQAAQVPLPFSPPPQQTTFSQTPSYFPQQVSPEQPGSVPSSTGNLQQYGSVSPHGTQHQGQYTPQYAQPSNYATPQGQSPQGAQTYHPVQLAYNPQGQQTFSPPLQQQQQQQQQQPAFSPPPQAQQQQQQQQQFAQQQYQQPPPGGYAQYNYGQAQQPTLSAGQVHQQVYIPTAEEAQHGHAPKPASGSGSGSWGKKTSKAEAKVSRFLAKLDKRL